MNQEVNDFIQFAIEQYRGLAHFCTFMPGAKYGAVYNGNHLPWRHVIVEDVGIGSAVSVVHPLAKQLQLDGEVIEQVRFLPGMNVGEGNSIFINHFIGNDDSGLNPSVIIGEVPVDNHMYPNEIIIFRPYDASKVQEVLRTVISRHNGTYSFDNYVIEKYVRGHGHCRNR
ncbi:hypothetical protein J4401_02550 [Candidatus Woesearchaeota archaeon]|nr:hypothetical protein [Candidatus Woesearchaeota archaeon]